MNEITFIILKIIISISVVAITKYILPCLKAYFVNKVDARVKEFIELSVRAAEQTIKKTADETSVGELKKETVISAVTNYLNRHNIEMSYDQLSDMIEAAVYEMNNNKISQE